MDALLLLFFFFAAIVAVGFALMKLIDFIDQSQRPKDGGTLEEMKADPELNTNNIDLHFDRLNRFGRSKYKGEWEYMGPRGGIYTITASGNRNYRY